MTIIPRTQHCISRQNISENALKVLYRLNKAGYEAYLVGGGVRDLLLGLKPKDFDIATNATPDQVRRLFRNCRLIGRRFRLAHILFGAEIIEVATFRGHHNEHSDNSTTDDRGHNGMLLSDNIFGSIEEDAWRRDFTINSLYYSAADFTVRDYVNGLADLQTGVIRLIGDPVVRYREDPVRMLRAVRFAARLNMIINQQTAEPISLLAGLLKDVPAARLFEETLKLLQTGHGLQSWRLLRQYQLSPLLFPSLADNFTTSTDNLPERMAEQALHNTDKRLAQGLRVNPAFLFAALFWYPLQQELQRTRRQYSDDQDAQSSAISNILRRACCTLLIPKRITLTIQDIWMLQFRLTRRHGKRAWRIVEHEKFRAAFDLLQLRATVENDPALNELQLWWHQFQYADGGIQQTMVDQLNRRTAPTTRRHNRQQSTSRPQP